jgi:hypothetical protein
VLFNPVIVFAAPFPKPDPYLDPGSGSIIVQVAIAAFLGALFIIKSYWSRIIAVFRKSNKTDQNTSPDMDK